MKRLIFILMALLSYGILRAETLKSPDGNIVLDFELDNGVPVYKVDYKGRPVIKESKLGLELKSGKNLTDGFRLAGSETSTFDETWKPVWGEVKEIRNHYNELEVTLEQPSTDRRMIIRFRVFDDGVGFRYEFPDQPNLDYFVIKEEKDAVCYGGRPYCFLAPGAIMIHRSIPL